MKDKSRFISSVIVSLLAGFIYYQFGGDINEKLRNSVRAVLSSNDIEALSGCDFPAFEEMSNFSPRSKKMKTEVTVKKRHVSFASTNDFLISKSGSEMQAKNVRPSADKNVDFTAELEQLVKSGDRIQLPSKQLKIETRHKSNLDGVADTKELRTRTNLLHKDFENKTGNGFEYNVMQETSGCTNSDSELNKLESFTNESGCAYEYNVITGTSVNKVKIRIPKFRTESSDKRIRKIEVNVEDDSADDDSM